MKELIDVDGSQGEGGGQVLRTSLSLSMITGRPLRLNHIRAGRRKPGLMRQHLACVDAAAQLCSADLSGAELRSTSLEFTPQQKVVGRDIELNIGSAGSTSLVLQTILPALLNCSKASRVILKGGTHNPMAPSFDFLCTSFFPLLSKMGWRCRGSLEQYGFYPAGGGEVHYVVEPSENQVYLELADAGAFVQLKAEAKGAHLPVRTLKDQAELLREQLPDDIMMAIADASPSIGPGNILSIQQVNDQVRNHFTVYGERGVKSERLISELKKMWISHAESGAAVEPHLADQLILPMLLAKGGCFTTSKVTMHLKTQMDIVNTILGEELVSINKNSVGSMVRVHAYSGKR